MESDIDIRSYLLVLRRRYLYLLLPAALLFTCAVLVAYKLPKLFESSATILVESQQIPTDLASPTVTANADERIHVIEQRLLARDNLLQVASKFNLYNYSAGQQSPTTIVELMRKAIDIQQIDVNSRTSRRDGGVIGFTVAFEYSDPVVTAHVTSELVQSILSQNIESRLSRATETSNFFKQQLKSLEQKLLDTENKIAAFKTKNESALPETLDARRLQLSQLTAQISDLDQKILQEASGDPTYTLAGGRTLEQLTYTLQAKKVTLKADQERRRQLAPLADKGFVPRNKITDLDRDIAVAQIDIAATQAQIAATGGSPEGSNLVSLLKSQREGLQKQVDALADGIQRTPVVEVELNSLNRDYENLQTEYKQAQAKLADALTGERLEQDRQAERFEVLEQPTVPDQPTKPNRPKIILAGSFGGIAAGAAFVVILELLDNSIRTTTDLEKYLKLRPIAVIPYVTTRAELRRRNYSLLALALVALVVASIGLALIHIYYLPLDLIMQRAGEKLHSISIT